MLASKEEGKVMVTVLKQILKKWLFEDIKRTKTK